MEERRIIDEVPRGQVRRLHREEISDREEITRIFEQLRVAATILNNGVDRRSAPRRASVVGVAGGRVVLRAVNIDPTFGRPVHFNCDLEGSRYFFSLYLERASRSRLQGPLPSAVYKAERRDLDRHDAALEHGPRRVELRATGGVSIDASVLDWSYQGLGVEVRSDAAEAIGERVEVRFLDGARVGESAHGTLRYRGSAPNKSGWIRLGLEVSSTPSERLIAVEHKRAISDSSTPGWMNGAAVAAALMRESGARVARRLGRSSPPRAPVEVIEYPNSRGHILRALVDSVGEPEEATAIVVPPAWGRTKETLGALAATLIRSFEKAGESLVVIRFDGTNRRGESYIDPLCRRSGDEYLRFTFSGAVDDIHATAAFLRDSPRFRASRIILVTFSLAAVETRRAIATDPTGLVSGWVSVVGMVDLQSGLRAVSGGVDYASGLTRGVQFGQHELVGVIADMDYTGADALAHGLVFLEDARRDMAKIRVPVTWIHGRHDGWMNLDRIRTLLSSGDISNRRLIEVPTGHQLRSSREALETFRLIASEAGRMATSRVFQGAMPDLLELREKERLERARRPRSNVGLRDFWIGYLLGRDRRLGIELMTATTAYRELMRKQVELLALRPDESVLDLGAGTGGFLLELSAREWPNGARVIAIDLITEALARARYRVRDTTKVDLHQVRFLSADLSLRGASCIPVADGVADAVLASLLLSYVNDPTALLKEARRCLRRGGRLVLSSLRRDADISRIYVDGVQELQPDRLRELFGDEFAEAFPELQRLFLNDAARLLELEELGYFRFWDHAELVALVRSSGFNDVRAHSAFGSPPQAIVITANTPS